MEILKKNALFLFLTLILVLFLQYVPYMYHSSQTSPDRVYLGAERYTPDYYIYLFYINQGYLGRITVSDFYTNEPHAESLVHLEYLLMGKAGSLMHFSVPTTFYFFRSLFLLIYLTVSFWFINIFLKNKLLVRLTFLLSIFWGGFFWLETNGQGFNVKSYFDFYQPPDLLNRLTYEPHKLIGMSLFLIFLSIFNKFGNDRKKIATILIPLALLIGLIHAVTAITLIFTFLIYLFLQFAINYYQRKKFLSLLPTLTSVAVIVVSLIALPLYWKHNFQTNSVWYGVFYYWESYFTKLDSQAPLLPTVTGYLMVLGPLIVLAVLGFKKFIAEYKNLALLVCSFLLADLGLFFLFYQILGTSKQRYYQTPYLLSLSILTTFGIIFLKEKLKLKKNAALLIIGLYTTLLLTGIPNFQQGLDRQLYQFGTAPNLDLLGYPPKDWYQGILWLDNTPKQAIILAMPTAGNIIPAIPGRKVVVGDYVHSYHYYEKLPFVTKFFQGTMGIKEAKEFVKDQKIDYVFWGYQEKSLGSLEKYFSFLTPVFTSDAVTVFKVIH